MIDRLLSPPDILLHHSGHIMLSDFDLAKHSGVNGGRPATIHQSELNGVSISALIPCDHADPHNLISFLWSTLNLARLISGPIRLWEPRVCRDLIVLLTHLIVCFRV